METTNGGPARAIDGSPSAASLYPEIREEFRVDVTLLWNDLTVRKDVAIVAFVDGWLVVESDREGFALRPCDVSVRGDGSITLAGGGWVRFDAGIRSAAFRRALREWGHLVESPSGEAVFPTIAVQPSILRREARFGLWGLPLLLGGAACLEAGGSWAVGTLGVVGLLAGVLPVATSVRTVLRLHARAQAVQALGRFER